MKIKIRNAFEEQETHKEPDIKIKIGSSVESVYEETEVCEPDIKIKINKPSLIEEEETTEPSIKIRVGQSTTLEEEDVVEEPSSIKIKISQPPQEVEEQDTEPSKNPEKITIKIGDKKDDEELKNEPPKEVQKTMKLVARRALNGDIMIFDHKDIDIVIKLSNGKIVAFPKDEYDDIVYETQLRLFEYLSRKGIVEYEGIQGGSMFMAMEAKLMEADDYDVPQIALVSVGKWIEQERPYFEWQEKWEEEQERKLLEPEEGEYTEFDPEKYHSPEKGSIRPKAVPFGTPGIYRF